VPLVRGIVLAAGAGSRFGGRKLEARLAGRPLLQHAIDALARAGIEDAIVVLAPDSSLEAAVAWRGAQRVVNPDPSRGLASSLQLGWAAALASDPAPDAVLVVLGDQPRLDPDVIARLVAAPLDPEAPVVAPRFAASTARNPVRIETSTRGARLVQAAAGDRGLGPLLDAAPDLVRWLDVPGDNPDVDVPADLAAAIAADWGDRVRRNRELVGRLRDTADEDYHYAPVAGRFADDPRRRGDALLDAVLALARPSDTWLDVGAGAGRYAFPLALAVREVIAVEPSAAMAGALRDGIAGHGLSNVRVVAERWPEALTELVPLPCADVAFIASVGHDTEAIAPFLDGLDAAARRLGVAVMQEQPPAAAAAPFFEAVHGEPREPLPALPELVDLLEARGAQPVLELLERPARRWPSLDDALPFLRRQTWVTPASAADHRLRAHLDQVAVRDSGGWLIPSGPGEAGAPVRVGIVRWSPRVRP
jgi:molybdenum cofactor cytidylyltransferase